MTSSRVIFFVTLALLYSAQNAGMSRWFRLKFGKDDNFIGKNAPNETRRYFGKAEYFVMGFTFWNLITDITFLDNIGVQITGFISGCLFLLLVTLAQLNLGSAWRVGLSSRDPGSP